MDHDQTHRRLKFERRSRSAPDPTLSASTPQMMAEALRRHRAGKLQQAAAICGQILEARPDHYEALNLLGVVMNQVGKYEAAIDLIRKAIALKAIALDPNLDRLMRNGPCSCGTGKRYKHCHGKLANRKHDYRGYRGILLQLMPKHSVCAEIGVWKGDFSNRIIAITQPRILHLVDPWMFQPGAHPQRHHVSKTVQNQREMDDIFHEVTDQFKRFDSVHIHRKTSKDFFQTFEHNLDWVYIDANHSKEFVMMDLILSWNCVRKGGIITGDDYFLKDSDGSYSVKSAVNQFCDEYEVTKVLIGHQYLMQKI